MTQQDKDAAGVVANIAKRCEAVRCGFLTQEIRRAVLLRDVLNPTVIRDGNVSWMLALHRAVEEFAL